MEKKIKEMRRDINELACDQYLLVERIDLLNSKIRKVEESIKEEQAHDDELVIADLNYLWGLTIAMAKTLGYSKEELDDIGLLFTEIEDYLSKGDEDAD